MARLTFPDQQQDLQNAAESSLATECDGSVKSPRRAVEADSGTIWLPDRGSGRVGRFRGAGSLCDHHSHDA
jgi:hypothetical protein